MSVAILAMLMINQAQAQWQWAVRAGDTGHDYGNSVTTDASGSIYMVGSFTDPVPSGNVTFGSVNVAGSVNANAYIAKYNSSGTTCNWVRALTSTGSAEALDVSVDGSFAYVSGTYTGTLTIGSFTLTNASGGTYYKDAFLAKINCSNGTVVWAVKDGIGGLQHDGATSVVARSGNVCIAGYNGLFYFVSKYNASGALQWKATSSAVNPHSISSYGESVKLDNNGNVYTYGTFRTSAGPYNFNSATGSGGTTTALTPISGDIFIAKYNSSGAIQFIKQIGYTSLIDFANGMTLDNQNNIYITGNVGGAAAGSISYFNGNGNPNGSITSLGFGDMFIAKYNSAGTFQWLKTVASAGTEQGFGITSDNLDNIFVVGELYYSSASIGCTNFINQNTTIIVAKYNSSGNPLWVEQKTMGGWAGQGNCIATDNAGSAIITGFLTGTGNSFGSTVLSSSAPATFDNEIYLAKISKPCANAGANGVICCGSIVIGTPALPGCTYSWTGAGLSPTNIAQPTCTATGTFTVACTTSTGCISTDELTVTSGPSCCTRLENVKADSSPTLIISSQNIQIINDDILKTIKEVSLTDITGKLILKQQCNDNNVNIASANFKQGLYFVKVTFSDNSSHLQKVVLKD